MLETCLGALTPVKDKQTLFKRLMISKSGYTESKRISNLKSKS